MGKILCSGVFLFLLAGVVPRCFAQDASGPGFPESGSAGQGAQAGKDEWPTVDLRGVLNRDLEKPAAGARGRASALPTTPLGTVESYTPPLALESGKNLSAVDPSRYFLEPGDSLAVEMWTPYHSRTTGVVSSLGTLNINPVGEIPVSGVSLRNLSAHLESALKQYYKDVHVTAELTQVRLVKVQVLGEVKAPGSYEVSGTSGALDAIARGGGLTDKSSLREIELRQENKPVRTLDYFKWRVFGDQRENPYLEPNEVVYVPVIKNRVLISGEVRRPGAYEMRSDETFGNLIEMAGGYTSEAVVAEAKLSRVRDSRSKADLPVSNSLTLLDGDSAYVPPLSLFMKKIKVMGEVNGIGGLGGAENENALAEGSTRVGWYRLHENERVRDVILNMGGLTPRADQAHARVERKDAHGVLTILPVNLQKLFAENDSSQNLLLQDGDALVVPAAASSVFVLGEVGRPGVVPYAPGNQVQEYLALAGGPLSHANLKHAKLIRQVEGSAQPKVYTLNLNDSLVGKTSESTVPVEPGDVIYIPRSEVSGLGDVITLVGNYAILKALFFH